MHVGALGEVIVRGGGDPPRLEHALPAHALHLPAHAIARARRTLEEPHARATFVVVDRLHLRGVRDVRARPQAVELSIGDERHVGEVVVAREEAVLGDEGARGTAVDEVHRRIARGLHERAVRMPERHRKHARVVVARGEVAREVAHRDAVHRRAERAVACGEREPLLRGAVDPVLRGVTEVAPDVHVIARGVPRRSLEPDELPRGHLAPVLHEDGGEVSHDDVRAITLVDVHVVAEVRVRIGVVHVGRAARGRVEDLVRVVARVEVRIVAGGSGLVGVDPVRSLATAVAVAVSEREVDRDGIATATRGGIIQIHEALDARAAPHEDAHEEEKQGDHELFSPETKRRFVSFPHTEGVPKDPVWGTGDSPGVGTPFPTPLIMRSFSVSPAVDLDAR